MSFSCKENMKTKKNDTDQARDTGLALVLILLLILLKQQQNNLILLPIFVLILTMLWPGLFRLPARLWFGLSELMGTISSKILLSIVFVLVLIPMAVLRQIGGADPMKRQLWKKNQDSVFLKRNHEFSASDLEKPY
jgi:hypothetical protein